MDAPKSPLIGLRVLLALIVVVIYGLGIYALAWLPDGAGEDDDLMFPLISGAFLLSAGIGSLLTVLVDPRAEKSFTQLLSYAVLTVGIICMLTVILFTEGIVCIIMAIPILAPGIMLGIVIASVTLPVSAWLFRHRL